RRRPPSGAGVGRPEVCETCGVVVVLVLLAVAVVGLVAAGLVVVPRAQAEAAAARARAERAAAELGMAEQRGSQALRDLPFVALRVREDGRLIEANAVALERFPFLVPDMTI